MKTMLSYQKREIDPQEVSPLEDILRNGARKMLQDAIEREVGIYLNKHQGQKDTMGHRLVTKNGYLPERDLLTGMGRMKIRQPRVRDKRPGEAFTSAILPKYMRRVPSLNNLIPILYLKGISTGDFTESLEAILGKDAPGLSATNIVRLKESWQKEYQDWNKRDLTGKHYVYIWADGIHFNVRLDKDRSCILVLMGALEDGTKELIAVHDGYRESKLSWQEMLRDVKSRGLTSLPKLATADGALGFWAALEEEFPDTKEQLCWVHKTANILDRMPKSVQPSAKNRIHDMYMSPTKEVALTAYDEFVSLYEAKYPKAVASLTKNKDALFTFYSFPAMHWQHIRSTNPIESTFATVRHRSRKTKGCGSRVATLTMVFKLCREAEKHWRKLRGYNLIPLVLNNEKFEDGELIKNAA